MASRAGAVRKNGTKRASPLKVRRASRNVFADLGFNAEEAMHLQIRSKLMATACRVLEERNLTQGQAAKLFDVSQPRVSDLVRGKIDLFSIDTLVDFLATAGVRVELRTRIRAA